MPIHNLLIYLDLGNKEGFFPGNMPCSQGILPEEVKTASEMKGNYLNQIFPYMEAPSLLGEFHLLMRLTTFLSSAVFNTHIENLPVPAVPYM
jgi:hypothetical protein